MERMLLYTFYILPSRRGLIVLSDLASSLIVLQVCTWEGTMTLEWGWELWAKAICLHVVLNHKCYEVELTKANVRL